jgi:hypothetical protein
MKIENPEAFSFILQDEIYLLNKDKTTYPANTSTAKSPEPVIETPVLNFNYLGKHKKQFLIITHYNGMEFIANNHLTALESTLNRLEFSLEDVAIFNIAGYSDASFGQIIDFFKPQTLLILGQGALPPGIEKLQLNKRTQIKNCDTLYTYSFDEMMTTTENKKIFWEQMKQL